MPLFASDEEYEQCSHDASLVAEKADAFIRELYNQLETSKAQADAASITAEQTCSLLEHKYVSLSSEFTDLLSRYSQLNSSLDERLSQVAQLQSDKHQLNLQSIEKNGEIERLSMEASEFHKSRRQLIELMEQKDLEISEKNATIKNYLDKIIHLTETAASKEARLSDLESELTRTRASVSRFSQEKELIERHNTWLNDELTAKVDSLIELRKLHSELEADMSAKLADVQKKFDQSSDALRRSKDRIRDVESKLTALEEEMCKSKDAAAASEERYTAEFSTVNRLVELYKESSEEWSKKAGELEGVIKALETHLNQVENDYKERLEKEVQMRREIEKEALCLKEKLEKCEADLENNRKALELNPLAMTSFNAEKWVDPTKPDQVVEDNQMLVPNIPFGVSGTALAASLLRDGWSLAKMYAKYQETVDALRHEQMGRKQSQAILERVLYEIEEKAGVILEERAEHEKLVEAYSLLNEKLQHSLSEQNIFEKTIRELKADLRKHDRDFSLAQKEISDLEKQVSVLLKECRNIQLRCGSSAGDLVDDDLAGEIVSLNVESDMENVISERLLTFKDINGLVEQNVKLRSLVRNLSDQLGSKELELKAQFEEELQRHASDAASKVDAVLVRSEEQGRMIESLHASVAMYRKLYEEEHKLHTSLCPNEVEGSTEVGRRDFVLLFENSQETIRKEKEKALERVKCLEEDVSKFQGEIILLRSERDKLALEAKFAHDKLDRFMKDFEYQREEMNGVIARNVEFSQLIIDHQRKLRESSESLLAAEECTQKLKMEVSILKHEKELVSNSEKRACDEVRSLSERVHRVQATLDTIQSAEEVREEARTMERRKQEEYIKKIEKEWAEAKKDIQEERNNVRTLTLEREDIMKNAMRQVEEIGKELSNALKSVAAAEARATAAETRCLEMEKNSRRQESKVSEKDGGEISTALADEIGSDLRSAKEEIAKLREEARVSKEHMLQYKGIAQVNEAALKQMECTYEIFRVEADKMRNSLENELIALRKQVKDLEAEYSLKTEEVAAAAAKQDDALSSALLEICCLKEENAIKVSQVSTMEIQLSATKDDLENERKKWRSAQENYERQVVLQSETIQELMKTSEALSSLQEEATHLRKLSESLKAENGELKAKWELEKSALEESKSIADKKYNEINEQNKILHTRLEALHIKLAEKDRFTAGASSPSMPEDAGLQNVVNYLRRSKEISETEISLLKQEKLRLQSQLEGALKAAEIAQASLNTERVNARSFLFTEEEFKSLQLQVREMNLLRESNMQLREENKHNFEECQKLRDASQKARIEYENLQSLLRERESDVEACRKEIEMQKVDKEHLTKRVHELLERCKNISMEDYYSLKEEVEKMQVNLRDKDSLLEEKIELISKKEDAISQLEQDLARSTMELSQKEARINETIVVEASLKSEVEKQKKLFALTRKKFENAIKEKEELSKENHSLSKQVDESRQGKKGTGDAALEQVIKEKEEKDSRIQLLEKSLEKRIEELKKERDERRTERANRLRTEKIIYDTHNEVTQEKARLLDELEKHKGALKTLAEEVEKLKQAKSSLPECTSMTQVLSGTPVEDLAASYLHAIESFERVSNPVSSELGVSLTADSPAIGGASSATANAVTGQVTSLATPSTLPNMLPSSTLTKVSDERENRYSLPKTNVELRKTGRKLVRPRISKPVEPQVETEMSESEVPSDVGKSVASSSVETHGNLPIPTQPLIRKRSPAASTAELQDDTAVAREPGSGTYSSAAKRPKGSDSSQEGAEKQSASHVESLEIVPGSEEYLDDVEDLTQDIREEPADAENDEIEPLEEQIEPKSDEKDQTQFLNDRDNVGDVNFEDKSNEVAVLDEQAKVKSEEEIQQSNAESGSDHEEGEIAMDVPDSESGGNLSNIAQSPEPGEVEPEFTAGQMNSVAFDDEVAVPGTAEIGDTSPLAIDDVRNDQADMLEENTDGSDNLIGGNSQVPLETDHTSETVIDANDNTSTTTTVEVGVPQQSGSVSMETEEGRQVSPVARSSTTINLHERARQRALLRQAGVVSPAMARGRGRAPRGRGGRRGRGQSSGE